MLSDIQFFVFFQQQVDQQKTLLDLKPFCLSLLPRASVPALFSPSSWLECEKHLEVNLKWILPNLSNIYHIMYIYFCVRNNSSMYNVEKICLFTSKGIILLL